MFHVLHTINWLYIPMTANTVGIWSCSFATVQLTRYIRSSSQFPSTTLITRPLSGLVSCTKIIIMCALCVLPYLLINLHWVTCTTARRAVTHTHTEKESVWLVNNGERSWFCDYLFCFIVEPSSLDSVITVIYYDRTTSAHNQIESIDDVMHVTIVHQIVRVSIIIIY